MEFVEFPKSAMTFSDFQVRQLDRDQLDMIVGNDVNRVFYPHATVDTRALQGYWFIVVRTQQDAPRLKPLEIEYESDHRVSFPKYSRFPSAVERVLQRLVLFDWAESAAGYGPPFGFNVPFVIRVDDNHLSSPQGAPDCSELLKSPDPDTGEDSETPAVFFRSPDLESFEKSAGRADDYLRQLEKVPDRWRFLNVAIGNLIKAFFADGLEQLLWHITALEALLGDGKGKPGLEATVARRSAVILATAEAERKKLRKRFKELYNLRCDLVHGRELKDETEWKQLFEARDTARRVTIWFVHYLGEIATRINQASWQGDDPKREDFLSLLDLNDAEVRSSPLLGNMPDGFPTAPDWSR